MSTSPLPAALLGTFKHTKNDGFDDYLASKGVPWIIRKMILISSHVISISASANGASFSFHNTMGSRQINYNGVRLGEQIEANGYDGKKHKVVFTLDDGVLSQKLEPLEAASGTEVYTYTIKDDVFIQKMDNAKRTCQRFYRREASK